jgi:formylglycine-generating enzyme required for sulfatase activity
VAYSYQIGKYDVTIGQYTTFLNAVAATDTYSLYNSNMGTDGNIVGISRTGSSGSYSYNVIGSPSRPITYVSWFDAARFANWMTNGQGNGGTEAGAYSLNNATGGSAVARSPGAAFYIPTENEWYKAAYYDPTLNGNAGGYYAFATQSNTAPGNHIGTAANQGNYNTYHGPGSGDGYSVTQSPGYSSSQNYLTDVGAFSGSGSFYGTFDQFGNVNQWNDQDGTAGSFRGLRGGYWGQSKSEDMSSSFTFYLSPSDEGGDIGFRLASPVSSSAVPEIDPAGIGSILALASGALCLLERRRLKAA